jgi:ribose 5-phosphate isomerase B
MKIGIAADHSGVVLKEHLKQRIRQLQQILDTLDFGAATFQPEDDYPDRVIPLARAVVDGRIDRGIAICGSGIGACVAANKIAGVRAAVCHDTYSARQGVEHDNMNVLVLGARVVGSELAWELVRAFQFHASLCDAG